MAKTEDQKKPSLVQTAISRIAILGLFVLGAYSVHHTLKTAQFPTDTESSLQTIALCFIGTLLAQWRLLYEQRTSIGALFKSIVHILCLSIGIALLLYSMKVSIPDGIVQVSKIKDPFWVAAIAAGIGLILWAFRYTAKAFYGFTEVAAGLWIAWHNAVGASVTQEGFAENTYIAILTGGVYLIVRGLDNIDQGMQRNAHGKRKDTYVALINEIFEERVKKFVAATEKKAAEKAAAIKLKEREEAEAMRLKKKEEEVAAEKLRKEEAAAERKRKEEKQEEERQRRLELEELTLSAARKVADEKKLTLASTVLNTPHSAKAAFDQAAQRAAELKAPVTLRTSATDPKSPEFGAIATAIGQTQQSKAEHDAQLARMTELMFPNTQAVSALSKGSDTKTSTLLEQIVRTIGKDYFKDRSPAEKIKSEVETPAQALKRYAAGQTDNLILKHIQEHGIKPPSSDASRNPNEKLRDLLRQPTDDDINRQER